MTQPSLDPQEVNRLHRSSDRDSSKEAQHHTLGLDPYQSSPGNHTHDGRDSKILSGLSVSTHSHDASDITTTPAGGLIATDVQLALDELEGEIVSHGHTAGNTAFTPVGGLASTNVQAALQELDTEKSATTHTHTAGAITSTAVGSLSATNVQAALAELDSEKFPKPVTPPSITGSRGGNAALASLLTELATLGLITDATTA